MNVKLVGCQKCCINELVLAKTEVGEAEFTELWKSWSTFRLKIEPIRKWQADK